MCVGCQVYRARHCSYWANRVTDIGRAGDHLRLHTQHEALQAAWRRQATDEFDALYDGRAGVEGTLSQGIRAIGLRVSNA
jgi:transposase